ncbi:SWIM zinc finger family protein [Pseudonocardia sp. NPDC049154]|uniref:SWIM zinc finger family protein n=1 Tax=Pseudonocardia sp. NPDC049154 TaxID=3155501 RepID=UPI0033CA6749
MRLDITDVERLADPVTFGRGREYAEGGAVGRVRHVADGVRATVIGSEPYVVELDAGPDGLDFRCSCPVGVSGSFCKHCVALALVAAGSPDTAPDPRAYLETLSHVELIDMILDAAGRDEVLHTRLAAAAADPDAPESLRRVLFDAIVPRGYVRYDEAYGYLQTVDAVVDRVEVLLDAGRPDLVLELTEYAGDCAERAVEYVDDSDGLLGGICDRLADLHLAACEAIRPDSRELARRLHARESAGGDLALFDDAVSRYADLLGEAGLAFYRDLVERDWAELPERGAAYDPARLRVLSTLEALAALTGDVDAEVEAMARDLSSTYRFLRIAERLLREDRHDDALRWAERGLELHGLTDARLVDLAAEEYQRAGRGAAAADLLRRVLDRAPTLGNYQRLAEHARRAGTWAGRRDEAFARLRAEVDRREPPRYRWQPPADASLLVEVLLWESDPDAAWAEAQRGGCSGPTVMLLARACQELRPLEVIPLYQREIEAAIGRKNNSAYAEAIELLGEVEPLFEADGFADHLAELRRTHRAKRNLMALLAARGW